MPHEFIHNATGSEKKIQDAESTYRGEQEMEMSPKLADSSAKHEEGFSQLSPEQKSLLKECNLTLKRRGPGFGGSGGSSTEIIKGTIEGGKKIEIVFDPRHNQVWEGSIEAKIDGKSIPRQEAVELCDKYYAIARFQTEDSARVKSANENPTIKAIREKILGILDK